MAKADEEKKELWIDWTGVALAAFEVPDLPDDADDAADVMVEVATKFADSMLDEYEARFETGGARRRKRGKTRRDEQDEEEDE